MTRAMPITYRHARVLRTFLRMYVEVGACVWAFATLDQPALKATAILAAYHAGALSRTLAERHYRQPFLLAPYLLPAGVLVTAAAYTTGSVFIALLGLAITGFSVPGSSFVTTVSGDNPTRTTKIFAKLCGMTAPAILPMNLLLYLTIGFVVSLLIIRGTPKARPARVETTAPLWNAIDLTNIFHQAGYFAFCFGFWSLAPAIAPTQIALFFPIGWIAYWIMELRLTRSRHFQQPLLTAGHLAFAAALLVMAATAGNTATILAGWFLTGLFGGTCYTMEHAPGGRPSSLSDDLGALLGSFTGALAIATTGQPAAAVVLGSGFACAAALAALRLIHLRADGERS